MGSCSSNEKLQNHEFLNIHEKKLMICNDCQYEFTPYQTLSTQTTRSDISLSSPQNSPQTSIQNSKKLQKSLSTSFSSQDKKQRKLELQQLKKKYNQQKEDHFLFIHMCIYDNQQQLYYCKHISSCSFAHKDYKEVEKHVMENHMDQIEKKHHKKFLNGIKKGEIGLNRNGSNSYYCTKCKILYENKQQHDFVCSNSNTPSCCIDTLYEEDILSQIKNQEEEDNEENVQQYYYNTDEQ